jgi:hypothetical protein
VELRIDVWNGLILIQATIKAHFINVRNAVVHSMAANVVTEKIACATSASRSNFVAPNFL